MLISFAPILVRSSGVPPTASAFYRMLYGGVFLLIVGVFSKARLFPQKRILVGLVLAGLVFSFDLFFWHRSIYLVGPGLATLLAGFQVFVLAIAGIVFFGERFRWQLAVAIPMAFIGVALIVGIDWSGLDSGYRTGVLFGLTTAVCYSTYLLTMRWIRSNSDQRASALVDVAWMSLACAAFLAVIASYTNESLAIPNQREALILVGYAAVAQIGWVAIASSLQRAPASLVGLILLLEPTFAYVWDIVFFARPVTRFEIFGAFVALAAIYLGSRRT